MDNTDSRAFAYLLISPKQEKEFESFKAKYRNKSKRFISKEILKTKSKLSVEVIEYHVHNLNHLAKMRGFIDKERISNIEYAKELLLRKNNYSNRKNNHPSDVENQYVSPTSLLLWFLILVIIW